MCVSKGTYQIRRRLTRRRSGTTKNHCEGYRYVRACSALEATRSVGTSQETQKVIFASSLGTVFEWYDFFLYGALAAVISKQFFAGVNDTTAFIFALMAFAAGFIVRPFGALVFGRLGT